MKSSIEILGLSVSTSNYTKDLFEKYDIQANIDEVENTENNSVFKYSFVILSHPKSIRISVDGIIKIFGPSIERDAILQKNEHDIPQILSIIYQELFPSFFMLSKSVNVPCPPYQILTLGASKKSTENESSIEETASESLNDGSSDTSSEINNLNNSDQPLESVI